MNLPPDILPVFHLAGTPAEMGRQHGEKAADFIHSSLGPRLDLCRDFPAAHGQPRSAEEIRRLAEACLPAHEAFCPQLLQELRATAEAAEVDFLELFIYNGFTDFKDLLYDDGSVAFSMGASPESSNAPGGCTTFAVAPSLTADGFSIIGQTWDMYSSALPGVCLLELQPAGAPGALMVSLAGCVGMFGCNQAGVAVCTNNLHAAAGRPGVFWPFLMRRILACRTFAEAAVLLDEVQLAGGHNFILAGRGGDLAEWEILPFVRQKRVIRESAVHTNHCLHPETQLQERLDGEIGRASSRERLRQAEEFFQETAGAPSASAAETSKTHWTPEALAALTRLESNSSSSPHSVCMRPVEGYPVETCAAAIMRPQTGEMWTLRGRPSAGRYRRGLVPGFAEGPPGVETRDAENRENLGLPVRGISPMEF